MIPKSIKLKNKKLPDTPGVYIMKNAKGEILYVGKAGNLLRRVTSYFTRPHDHRIQKLVSEIKTIDYHDTETAIEALILEAKLIKQHQPPFNVREKDDTSFLYIEITERDEQGKKFPFPPVLLVRGKDAPRGKRFGPFTAASQAREALKIIRKIFPFSVHKSNPNYPNRIRIPQMSNSKHSDKFVDSDYTKRKARPCFDYEIGLCPGTCAGAISRSEYQKHIHHITLFLEGKKHRIIRSLEKEMKTAARRMEFENADRLKRQLFSLQHIQDVALIKNEDAVSSSSLTPARPNGRSGGSHISSLPYRIEGYDISNISGDSAVGSMVVFVNGKPDKNEYRKFRIKTVVGSNDVAMVREVLSRRFRNAWALPDLILIDGGLPQARAAAQVVRAFRRRIPIVGLAKGPERKRNDVIGAVPEETDLATLIRVRDEAHRFAVSYHKKLRGVKFFG